MTQLSMGVLACQTDARFPKAHKDVPKDKYWESTLEDALDVIAKVSRVAAIVYHNCYGNVISSIHSLLVVEHGNP